MSNVDRSTRDQMLFDMQLISQSAIQSVLDGKEYNEQKVENWCQRIIKTILKKMKTKFTPQYKFVANSMILSRRSQYVNETQMALWDTQIDVKITTKWANESMQCIVSLWGFRTRLG